VFMFGPSSHTIARGNTCQGNHGAGIAAIGDLEPAGPKWKAYHWIIEGNRLIDNRWGLYLQRADWLDIAGNTFRNNTAGDVHQVDVTRLTEHPSLPGLIDDPPHVLLKGPERAKVGEAVTLDASGSTDPRGRSLDYRWDLGDGSTSLHSRVSHVFTSPGFKRLGLTVNNDSLSDLAWRDLYVVDDVSELGTEGQAKQWGWIDPRSRVTFSDDTAVQISGRSALFALVDPYGGERVSLLYPATRQAGWSLKDHSRLVFWVKVVNENVPAWQGPNPLITLYESAGRSVVLTPKADFLSQPFHNEEREGWRRFEVPLAGDEQWVREGPALATVNYLTIGFDSWGAPPLRIWIDGLYFQ
jgi:parallel beta-helix repeat protein